MEDSIERILEDARKNTSDYWDCDVRKSCGSCPSKTIDGSCETAQSIDLVKRTRALFERQLPEGVEWPRFEDGELVKVGDEVEYEGETMRVYLATFNADGWALWCSREGIDGRLSGSYVERVKRPEPADTQEKIDADAGKSFCEYFGHGSGICKEGDVCEAHGSSEPCRALMIRDLLRRQRELCEREAR